MIQADNPPTTELPQQTTEAPNTQHPQFEVKAEAEAPQESSKLPPPTQRQKKIRLKRARRNKSQVEAISRNPIQQEAGVV